MKKRIPLCILRTCRGADSAPALYEAHLPWYLEEIEKEVRIYAGLKTLIVERDTHCPMPQFRAMLEGTVY